jgi:hypothetical protein
MERTDIGQLFFVLESAADPEPAKQNIYAEKKETLQGFSATCRKTGNGQAFRRTLLGRGHTGNFSIWASIISM